MPILFVNIEITYMNIEIYQEILCLLSIFLKEYLMRRFLSF